jgi:hypothetical protein
MLTLINGDGNPRVTAAQDADWYGSLTGEKTCIMPANDKFSATVADANTIEISSGVLITKEGRRVQVDAETIEEIIIPTGTQGVDTYYIIGFHLYIDESGQQVAETFVETMENESDTITETTFREGSTSIYISLYRVKRSGLTLESVTRICPMYELSADEIVYGNTNVGAKLTQINSDLSDLMKADIGTNVVIWNGTGSAPSSYVAPSDGYLWAYIASNDKYITFRISGKMATTFSRNASIPSDASPVFIRKGTTITNITTNDTSGSSSLQFFPFV